MVEHHEGVEIPIFSNPNIYIFIIHQLYMAKKDLRFLKDAIKDLNTGKRQKVFYTQGGYTKESGLSENTITIYARKYAPLPKQLNPLNNTDTMTDYFETDTVRVKPSNKYYKDVLMALKKKEAFNKKIQERRDAKLKKMGIF